MGPAWDGEDSLAFVERIKGFAEELKVRAIKTRQCKSGA